MSQSNLNVDLTRIFELIGVASPIISNPTPVYGGLLHQMWRVETENGVFAVKVLNPEIMSRPDAKRNFRNSERVAQIARSNGIRAVTARTVGNDPWFETDGSYVMIFDWVNGSALRPDECTVDHAVKMGEVLHQIHSVAIMLDDVQPPTWSGIPEEFWEEHMNKAGKRISCWGLERETLLSDVTQWSQWYQDAAERLSHKMIMSHGDLDAKNVLWNLAQNPYLIDWESAGYLNPTVELVDAAINWSRSVNGTLDKTRFQALIRSYVKAGGSLSSEVLDALYGSMGGMLGWLEYNMRRSLDDDVFDSAERQLGQKEVQQTVNQLRKFADGVFEYERWCKEALGL